MTEAKAFLVFSGTNDRAVLAFLRALSLCGHRAYIVARTSDDRILRTSYRGDVVLVRDTSELTLPILVDCIKHVRATCGDKHLVMLPSSEYFNHFILQHRDRIEALGVEIPLVGAEIYERLTNKRTAAALFASAGVAVPREIASLDSTLLPLVAKPIRNVSSRGVTLYPALLHTLEDVRRFEASGEPSDFFFQEFVRGDSLYLFVHRSRDPQHLVLWSQRNLLQQPQGKSMLLADPAALHDEPIAQQLVEVLSSVGFEGLCMIELIRDAGRLVFIEMNPRIWGPLQFCIDQDQPLLQAFVGKWLHDDPVRYISRQVQRRRRHYFWTGGLLETVAAGARADWHAAPISWFRIILIAMRNDIYLRGDSWRCFFFEIGQLILKVIHGDRNKR